MTALAQRWPLGSGKRIAHGIGCVVGFEVWQVAMFALAFGVLRIAPNNLWKGDPTIIGLTCASGLLGFTSLAYLGIVRFGRVPWRDLGWHTERLGPAVALASLGLVLLSANVIGVLAVTGALGEVDVIRTITGYTASQRLLFLVIGASAAAIEETLFRGYLQPALVAKTNLVAGILIGAAVFALYHLFMGPSAIGLVAKFVSGVILGALRGRDRSLAAPMLAHFAMWQIFGSI